MTGNSYQWDVNWCEEKERNSLSFYIFYLIHFLSYICFIYDILKTDSRSFLFSTPTAIPRDTFYIPYFFLCVDKKDTNMHFCICTITGFCSYPNGIYIVLQFVFLNLYVIHILPCKDILHKIS